eukprot:TRINITY_DN13081_c0_g1_i1.p1 TRINITY_DN13081_c0_g1~~TRINITY_DN13081_c0_g1_i1.p1  ORF type:complete len:290 (-),score=96.96 TRINITY_DN13081_c0_g1_i1:54-923(-)
MLRLVTFQVRGNESWNAPRIGALTNQGREVVDLSTTSGIYDMKSWIEKHPEGSDEVIEGLIANKENRRSIDSVILKAPIQVPEKIICVGLNYYDHAKESNMEVPKEPLLFPKYPNTIIGHKENIAYPEESQELDYEAELVIVIGKEGRRIKEEKALDHIFGYTCGNDVSARDWQLKRGGGQWMMGKSWDTFAPLGPSLVTRVTNPQNLNIKCILNGETVQDSNTKHMIFSIPRIISHISTAMTLKPGDVIFTGTPPGVGMARKPQLFMKKGDVVKVVIDEVGELENTVA